MILFKINFTLFKLKASTCFGHHLTILRGHYTTLHYTHQNCVRVVHREDGQVMPETCRGFEFE
jgi:hypothetical protein